MINKIIYWLLRPFKYTLGCLLCLPCAILHVFQRVGDIKKDMKNMHRAGKKLRSNRRPW